MNRSADLTYDLSLGVQVVDFLGSAAFSKAVQAIDLKTQQHVCLKIIKVCIDCFFQA